MKALLIALVLASPALGALTPKQAAALSARDGESRRRPVTGRWLLTLGFHEVRDSSPNTLVQADLQYALLPTFTIGLQALAPTKRKDLRYSGGGTLNWYGRAPYSGLWMQAGFGRYVYRGTSGVEPRNAFRALLGWRWHPQDHTGSLGFALGPEMSKVDGKTVLGGVVRLDVGVDFGLREVFF